MHIQYWISVSQERSGGRDQKFDDDYNEADKKQ